MVVKFRRGNNFIGEFKEYLQQHRVNSGFFYGLGGFSEATLAFYDLKNKKYLQKKLKGSFEVLSLTGNIAQSDEGIVIHAHAVLGDKNYRTFGGHLIEGVVAGTLEIKLTQTEMLERAHDSDTGLNLLK